MFRIETSAFNASIFVIIMFLWPIGLNVTPDNQIQLTIKAIVIVVNALFASLVWYYNSSKGLTYFEGLENISESYQSGIAFITFVYMPFILAFAYIMAIYYMLHGMTKGRLYTQEHWRSFVNSFRKH